MAPHVNPFALLGGALRGTLPNPTLVVDEAGLAIAGQVFGPRRQKPFDVRAGANITATVDAGGVTIASTGGAGTPGDDVATLLPGLIFGPHQAPPSGLAGGDLAGVYPSPTVKGENLVDALRAFLPHPRPIPKTRAGTNVTIVEDALGYVVSASGAAGPAGPAGSAVLDLVESHDFAAPATSYTFAGLNGDADEVYLLVYKIVKAVVATMLTTIRPNGLTTNQATRGEYNGTAAGTINTATLEIAGNGTAATGGVEFGQVWINAKTGTRRLGRGEEVLSDGASLLFFDYCLQWDEAVTNITSLDVVADQANGIDAGSFARLYKLRKAPGVGNFAEVTVALDGNLVFTTTVTGQAWVTATSKIICQVFAVAASGTTEEMAMASGVTVGAKNRVAGVGFDVWVYNPQGMSGTLTIHCIGG